MMHARLQPRLPIPEALRGSDPNSFAHDTISERLPRIGRRVLAENAFDQEVAARLEALVAELPDGQIRPLSDSEAPDADAWSGYITLYAGQSWLEVPWFFAETYFYRRILEATGYFVEGARYGADPFRPHKEQSLEASLEQMWALAERLQAWQEDGGERKVLEEALSQALWGNQEDLSMWPGGGDQTPSHADADTAAAHILVDDRSAVAAALAARRERAGRIDLLMDNAGMELASDLALVDVLLGGRWADAVVLDVKFHPTFVSDVTPEDVRATMRTLARKGKGAAQAWGRRLIDYADNGRLMLRQHPFWTSPLAGWEMPAEVRQTLAEAELVISKGDANYRRLLGDRHWAYTTPFEAALAYFPAPLLALRTLKSNVAAGLAEEVVRELDARDRRWVISGEWGVIQFFDGSAGKTSQPPEGS